MLWRVFSLMLPMAMGAATDGGGCCHRRRWSLLQPAVGATSDGGGPSEINTTGPLAPLLWQQSESITTPPHPRGCHPRAETTAVKNETITGTPAYPQVNLPKSSQLHLHVGHRSWYAHAAGATATDCRAPRSESLHLRDTDAFSFLFFWPPPAWSPAPCLHRISSPHLVSGKLF
jgi:hypothetical protein